MLVGLESSSTNIASDHGDGKARRSTAITSGRSLYASRRISRGIESRPLVSEALGARSSSVPVDLRIGQSYVGRRDPFRWNGLDRFRQPAHVKGVHCVKPGVRRRNDHPRRLEVRS
jgi:hypothetical protein